MSIKQLTTIQLGTLLIAAACGGAPDDREATSADAKAPSEAPAMCPAAWTDAWRQWNRADEAFCQGQIASLLRGEDGVCWLEPVSSCSPDGRSVVRQSCVAADVVTPCALGCQSGRCVAVGQELPMRGRTAGIAAFNSSAEAPEGASSGYPIPAPMNRCAMNAIALSQLASADYADLGPVNDGLFGSSERPMIGFAGLAAALSARGRSASAVTLRFSLMQLETEAFSGHPEQRVYSGGTFQILYRGERLLAGDMPDLHMTIDYRVQDNCHDDRISGRTDPARVVDDSAGSSPEAREIAAAFLRDLAGNRVALDFASFQPAVVAGSIRSQGRMGAFFTAGDATLRVVR